MVWGSLKGIKHLSSFSCSLFLDRFLNFDPMCIQTASCCDCLELLTVHGLCSWPHPLNCVLTCICYYLMVATSSFIELDVGLLIGCGF